MPGGGGDRRVAGVGVNTCEAWTAARQTKSAGLAEQWLLGFVSGASQMALMSDTISLARVTNVGTVWAWIDVHCLTNPHKTISDAGIDFVVEHSHKQQGG